MIETPEQFERTEEAITQMKRFLLAARRTHAPEVYMALSAPILRELQERERDALTRGRIQRGGNVAFNRLFGAGGIVKNPEVVVDRAALLGDLLLDAVLADWRHRRHRQRSPHARSQHRA